MTMRRLLACLLAMALLLCTGCTVNSSHRYESTKYVTEYAHKVGYNRLNDTQKAIYGTLYTAVMDNLDQDTEVNIKLDDGGRLIAPGIQIHLPASIAHKDYSELEDVIDTFRYENPQFIHLNNHTFYNNNIGFGAWRQHNTIYLLCTMDVSTRTAASAKMEEAIATILSNRPDTEDQYLTELYLHDSLLSVCDYDYDAAREDEDAVTDFHSRTAYGALVEGQAICSGYTLAMSLLLERCGISSSFTTSADHVWNLVHINGENYYLDATWNEMEANAYHYYFNTTSKLIEETHEAIDANTFTVATAVKDNYYYRTGLRAYTRDRDALAEQIAHAVKSGDEHIEILTKKSNFEFTLNYLRSQDVFIRVNRYLSDDHLTMWGYKLSYIEDKNMIILDKSS